MIDYRDDVVVALSPHWRIRPDHNRGLIYRHSINDLEWQLVSLPVAVTMALMDGVRPASKVIDDLVELLDLTRREEGLILYNGAIGVSNASKEPFLIEVDGRSEREINRVNLKKFLELSRCPASSGGAEIGQLQSPIQLLLMPTNRCQTDCIYCYAERRHVAKHDELSPARWGELIAEAGGFGLDMVVFSGGDPLLYPGIESMLADLSKWQIDFVLPTKKYVSKAQAQRLATLCAHGGTVQISIDGVTPAIVDFMVGRANACEKAWRSLGNLIDCGVPVRTQSVVTPLNLPDVGALVHRLHDVGVREATITNYSRSFYRHADALFLSESEMDELRGAVAAAKDELSWNDLRCNASVNYPSAGDDARRGSAWMQRAGCSGGKSSFAICPNGDVILCEQMPQQSPFVVGNVARASLTEVWHSPVLAQSVVPSRGLFHNTACETCEDFEECHRGLGRCFRDAYFVYGNLYHPPPNCVKAPPSVRMG